MNIKIWKDADINLYTVECDNGNTYECLGSDEVAEIVAQELKNAD